MTYDMIMIHFGELSTKGNNRRLFVQALLHNVRVALKKFPGSTADSARDHIYVQLGAADPSSIIARLQQVSGIQRLSLVAKVKTDLEEISAAVIELIKQEKGHSFKVKTRRSDKTFPLDSMALSAELGGRILEAGLGLAVDVHDPDITVNVNLREQLTYIWCHDYPGLGGYPLGMSGKVTMLLSGGIDSPVAAQALIRRGIKVECLHFASPPYTQMAVIDKLKDILKVLNGYQEDIKLQVVPFTKLQQDIYRHVAEPYCITVMRRMMMRIATALAKKNRALAIATGESIGQVASQTLESLSVINAVTPLPVIRPLAVADKVSIVDKAKEIGTYEISIRPYEDCCTIFKPKKPKTKPNLKECEFFESQWDWQSQIEECVAQVSDIYISGGAEVFAKKQAGAAAEGEPS